MVPTDGDVNELIDELQDSTGLDLSEFISGALLAQLLPSSSSDAPSLPRFSIRPLETFQSSELTFDRSNLPDGISLSGDRSSDVEADEAIRFEAGVENLSSTVASGDPEPFTFSRITDFDRFAEDLSQKLTDTQTEEGFGKLMDSVLMILSRTFLRDSLVADEVASEPLYHPNGEVLSWAMFYKFLAQKSNLSFAPGAGEEWFTPYESWFRSQYSQYPYFDASAPAAEEIVINLFGGLPLGVTKNPPEVTVASPTFGGGSPLLDFAEPQEALLYHPNGQVLSWAMFYKFLAQQQGLTLTAKPGELWFVPYENWFQDTYTNFPFYDPSEPARPSIVRGLYGGIPSGVTSQRPITGVVELIQDPFFRELLGPDETPFPPIEFQVSADEAQQYADARYASEDEQLDFFLAGGLRVTWSRLWPLIVQREANASAASGGRPVIDPETTGQAPYQAWFQRYFPELPVPSMEEPVTLGQARYFLRGQLPEGSYGTNAKLQQILKVFSPATGSTSFGDSSLIQSVEEQDSVPVYIVESPEGALEEHDLGLDYLATAILSLGEEREILRIEEELSTNPAYQEDLDAFISGPGQPLSPVYADTSAAEATPNLAELTEVLFSVYQAPSFLESLRILTQLFAFEEGEIIQASSEFAEEVVLPAEDDDLPFEDCSQTSEGVIVDDHPDCQPFIL